MGAEQHSAVIGARQGRCVHDASLRERCDACELAVRGILVGRRTADHLAASPTAWNGEMPWVRAKSLPARAGLSRAAPPEERAG